jgi:short-subunit dehydrogenase
MNKAIVIGATSGIGSDLAEKMVGNEHLPSVIVKRI